MPSASSSTAATGSLGRPIVRANTFVDPPGQRAERGVGAGDAGGHLVERAVAAEADDDVDAAPGGVVGEAGGVAPRFVSTSSTSWLRLSRRCTTTVLRAVTDDANEFTTSRIRKPPNVPVACRRLVGRSGDRRLAGWGNPEPVGNNERP